MASTRQRLTPVAAVTHPAIFAEGQFAEGQALGKGLFAEGSWGWPSANRAFVECPRSSPRQTQKPSAKRPSLVVIVSLVLTVVATFLAYFGAIYKNVSQK